MFVLLYLLLWAAGITAMVVEPTWGIRLVIGFLIAHTAVLAMYVALTWNDHRHYWN